VNSNASFAQSSSTKSGSTSFVPKSIIVKNDPEAAVNAIVDVYRHALDGWVDALEPMAYEKAFERLPVF